MAIVRDSESARLQVRVDLGLSPQGNPVLRTRSFNRVKSTATDETVHAIGVALASLQQHPLYSIRRVDESDLVVDGE